MKLIVRYSIYIFVYYLLYTAYCFGQDTKDDKSFMDATQKQIKKGDNFIYYGQKNYEKALEHYLIAYNNNENHAELNLKIGECYLHTNKEAKSIYHLEKAHRLNKKAYSSVHFLLGMAYHLNADFNAAIKEYKEYIENYKMVNILMSQPQIDSAMKEVNKKIKECEHAKQFYNNPIRVFIDNLGGSVNSSFPEYDPFITADGSMLFFTSRRENSIGGKKSDVDYKYFEDIYVSSNNNGQWGASKNLGKPVNTKTNDAVIGISIDGQKLFVYRDANGGDIYLSELVDDKWSKPVRLNRKFNTKSHESSAAFSFNQRIIYFISDKTDAPGFGGKDIYMCRIDENGKWGTSVNIGSKINTPYDETCVFAHPNGKTIYFSSKGHNTMGGFDIFKSTFNDGKWSEPENLGYPINTVRNEVSFVLSANGKKGYYSSSKAGGKGDKDIYVITFPDTEKEGALKTKLYLLNENRDTVNIAYRNEKGLFVFELLPDDPNYMFILEGGKDADLVDEIHIYAAGEIIKVKKGEDGFFRYKRLPYKLHLINEAGDTLMTAIMDEEGSFAFEKLPPDQTYLFLLEAGDTEIIDEITIVFTDDEGEKTIIKVTKKEANLFNYEPLPHEKTKLHLINQKGDTLATGVLNDDGFFLFKKLPHDINYIFMLDGENTELIDEVKILVEGEPIKKAIKDEDGFFRFSMFWSSEIMLNLSITEVGDVLPELKEEEKVILNAAFSNLEFGFGTYNLKHNSKGSLDELAELLKSKPEWKIKLGGHTDNIGSKAAHMTLSKQRVESVKRYLAGKGVVPDRIITKYFGEKYPIADNSTPEGRQKNRRVEMLIVLDK